MKKIILLFLCLYLYDMQAQQPSNKAKTHPKHIYLDMYHTSSSTIYNNGTSTSTTGYRVRFRVGEEGEYKKLGRKGRRLREAIIDDQNALSELKKANIHLRKKRIFNVLEYTGYVVGLGSMVPLVIGLDNYEKDGITPLAIAGAAGMVAGFTGVIVFKHLTEKQMNAWAQSIMMTVDTYNRNLKSGSKAN